MFDEQIPYVPKNPPLPDLPWDGVETADFLVPVKIALDSIQIRLDTRDFSIKYQAGVKGTGLISASVHGRISLNLQSQLEQFCKQQIAKLYV